MGGLEWWHWVIIGLVFLLLFGGYKKLPSATKSIAQSMKIFKDETKGLRGGDESDDPAAGTTPSQHPQHDNAGALAAPNLASPGLVVPPAAPTPQPAPAAAPHVAAPPAAAQPAVAQPGSLAPQPGEYAGKRTSS